MNAQNVKWTFLRRTIFYFILFYFTYTINLWVLLNYFSFCPFFFSFSSIILFARTTSIIFLWRILCFRQPFFLYVMNCFIPFLLYYISCMYQFWYIILCITQFHFFIKNSWFFILSKNYNISLYQLKYVHFHTLLQIYLFFYILSALKNDVIHLLRKESNSLLVIQYWGYY